MPPFGINSNPASGYSFFNAGTGNTVYGQRASTAAETGLGEGVQQVTPAEFLQKSGLYNVAPAGKPVKVSGPDDSGYWAALGYEA